MQPIPFSSPQIVSLILIVSLATPMTADKPSNTIRLCGKRLITVLKAICVHGLASPKQRSQALGGGVNRGIADACCIETCTVDYVRTYCKPEPLTVTRRSGSSSSAFTYNEKTAFSTQKQPHYRHHSHVHHRPISMTTQSNSAFHTDVLKLLGLKPLTQVDTLRK